MQVYQTKALVNIATLHLESGDTHQAIVYYRKLLCLETELLEEAGSDAAMPGFWTRELQCGLYLNLSIAYKTIGNMSSAIVHAHRYTRLAEQFGLDQRFQVGFCVHFPGLAQSYPICCICLSFSFLAH